MNVNAPDEIKDFYFYQEYLWTPEDFENLQLWLKAQFQALAEGAFGAAILGGCEPTCPGGMFVDVAPGIGSNYLGRPLIHKEAGQATLASDVSNPRRSLIVLRSVDTDEDDIVEPTNPPTQVPLHKLLSYSLTVIAGTPGVNPTYPAKQAGDVIVCGVKLAAGQTNIAQSDIDFSQTERPRTRSHKVRVVTADYTVAQDDEIIEADCAASGITVTLPVSQSYPGKEVRIVKIDSSSNSMFVEGTGGEEISGLSEVEIDTPFDSLRVYANGIDAWRRM